MLRLARVQEDFLERDQFLLRPWQPRFLVPHVYLDYLRAADLADVADSDDHFNAAICHEVLGAERGSAVFELRVRKAVAKGEERCHLDALVVPIADIVVLTVHDVEVLAGPVVVSRRVF
jgi:hypothetical protein